MPVSIMLDAGHGGRDPGAVYNGRQEKDDVLKLVLAIGEILQNSGIDVEYTRTTDIYETPFQKATEANEVGFINSDSDNTLFDKNFYDIAQAIADGILDTLEEKGLWKPEGARNSSTASESGRTSSDADTSASVSPADVSAKSDVGTLTNSGSVPDSPCTSDSAHMNPSDKNTDSEFPNSSPSVTYSVQVGAFRNPAYARRLLNELTEMDFPARIDDSSQYDRVLVGQFDVLNDAAMMERRLKQSGYPTVIVSFSEEA